MYRFFMESNNLRNPKKFAQKIIYLCMVIVSINLSANWLATSTVKLVENQNDLASFDDILRLNLSMHSISIYFAKFFNEERKKLGYLDNKEVTLLTGSNHVINCIDDALKYQNVCCSITRNFLDFYLNLKFKEKREVPNLKILDSVVFSNYWSYIYEEASPYVGKICSIVQKIKESGIDSINIKLRVKLVKKFHQPAISEDSFLITKFCIVLAIGYSISLFVLILEILLYEAEKRFDLNQYKSFKILMKLFKKF